MYSIYKLPDVYKKIFLDFPNINNFLYKCFKSSNLFSSFILYFIIKMDDQTVNSFASSQTSNSNQQPATPRIDMTSSPQHSNHINDSFHSPNYNYNGPNITFECYLPLPNDTRIYHVRYTELHPLEIAQLLNDGINLPHIPDYQLPHHYNIQSLIQQQIQQQVQQSVESQIYQQNNIQQNNIQQEFSDIEDPNYISGISGMGNYN